MQGKASGAMTTILRGLITYRTKGNPQYLDDYGIYIAPITIKKFSYTKLYGVATRNDYSTSGNVGLANGPTFCSLARQTCGLSRQSFFFVLSDHRKALHSFVTRFINSCL